jgi:hypothetical protein
MGWMLLLPLIQISAGYKQVCRREKSFDLILLSYLSSNFSTVLLETVKNKVIP